MAKKSILMVVRKYPADFGHTTVIDNLCNGLNKMGYRTAIGAFSFTKDPPNDITKVNLKKLDLLVHGVNKLDYDIIHTHQALPNYFLLTVKPKKPIVLHYHGASNKLQRINFKISMTLYKKRFTKIISVSKAGITQMKKMISSITADVVYNGVDTKFYNPDLPPKFKKGEPQLLFVGGLRPYKNTTVLVNMMPKILKQYPQAHLQIVGEGDDYDKLVAIIKEKKLEQNIELTGKISNDELKLRYVSCDIYISASTFEVCPVPTLEAMACGKPLILYDIEPHKEITDISKAGITFSSENEICDKITDVYNNKNLFIKNALTFAENHDWNIICKQVAQIYDDITN